MSSRTGGPPLIWRHAAVLLCAWDIVCFFCQLKRTGANNNASTLCDSKRRNYFSKKQRKQKDTKRNERKRKSVPCTGYQVPDCMVGMVWVYCSLYEVRRVPVTWQNSSNFRQWSVARTRMTSCCCMAIASPIGTARLLPGIAWWHFRTVRYICFVYCVLCTTPIMYS